MDKRNIRVIILEILLIVVLLLLSIYLLPIFPAITLNLFLSFQIIILVFLLVMSAYEVRSLKKYVNNATAVEETNTQNIQKIVDNIYNYKEVDSFIISTVDLLDMEKGITEGEIWVTTHEIFMDLEEPFISIISNNLERGVTYKYFLPKNTNMMSDFKLLKSKIKDKTKLSISDIEMFLKVVWLSEKLIRYSVTIYCSLNLAFQNVPHSSFEKDFFFKYDEKYATRLIGLLNYYEEKLRIPDD